MTQQRFSSCMSGNGWRGLYLPRQRSERESRWVFPAPRTLLFYFYFLDIGVSMAFGVRIHDLVGLAVGSIWFCLNDSDN
jgi:hypothetical protein